MSSKTFTPKEFFKFRVTEYHRGILWILYNKTRKQNQLGDQAVCTFADTSGCTAISDLLFFKKIDHTEISANEENQQICII